MLQANGWYTKPTSLALFALIIFGYFNFANSVVYLSPPAPVLLGSTTTLYCNLSGETLNGYSWKVYNGSASTTLNLGTTISVQTPSRYTITATLKTNSTTILSTSTLQINGVTADDFTTFECVGATSSKANLTMLVITTTTIAPVRCLLDNYNYALYIMIILSNIALGIATIAIYQFISDPTNFQLLLLFGILLCGVILVIVMILFWISPNFVSGDPQVWSPVVIIACGYGSLVILWVVTLVLLGMVFKSENIIEIPVLVIVVVICAIQLALIAAVLTGVGYCTNTTSLSRYTSDPQIVNVVLGGVVLLLCLIVLLLMLWKHKGQKKIISVQSAGYNNVRDHSYLSGFFGVRSAPSENLSPTSIKNGKIGEEDPKSKKGELPLLPVPNAKVEKEKAKETKEKAKPIEKEAEKPKDKGKKEDDKKKKEDDKKALKLPDLKPTAKSPDSSFGSMDFDQNELRRSTPNAEEVESVPKTTNPLLMNFIKNSNDQKNLEAINEETEDGKNKGTPKTTPKVTPKGSKGDINEAKDSSRKDKDKDKEKKDKKEKKADEKTSKKKKEDEAALKENTDADSLNGDRGSNAENLFAIDPITDNEDKKKKKAGKGKTKTKE